MQQRLTSFTLIAIAAFAVSLLAPTAHAADGEKEAQAKVPECVKVRPEARYSGLGYDHVIELENTCEKAMDCTVVTDINKQSSSHKLAPKQKETVVTFRGSPAREFKADVSCKEAS